MNYRLFLCSFALFAIACTPTGAPRPDAATSTGGLTPAQGGGFCCAIESPSCNCFANGGWVPTNDPQTCPRLCDAAPPANYSVDAHGCQVLNGLGSCLSLDAGHD